MIILIRYDEIFEGSELDRIEYIKSEPSLVKRLTDYAKVMGVSFESMVPVVVRNMLRDKSDFIFVPFNCIYCIKGICEPCVECNAFDRDKERSEIFKS